MAKLLVVPLTSSQKSVLPQLAKDFRAALSYVSFYSFESPFVTQAVKKLGHELSHLLAKRSPLLFKREGDTVYVNGNPLPESDTFARVLESYGCPGVLFLKTADYASLVAFLRKSASPSEKAADLRLELQTQNRNILWADEDVYELTATGVAEEPASEKEEKPAVPNEGVPVPEKAEKSALDALDMPMPIPVIPPLVLPVPAPPDPPDRLSLSSIDVELAFRERTELLLGLLAEAWQYSRLLKRHKTSHPETDPLDRAFDRLFNRMLSKLEAVSPEFADIHDWFSTPEGETLSERVAESMLPLLEVAVKNGWTSVMCDSATEGLVEDCLATWGATGKHELVDRAVTALSESLMRPTERRLALSHLRDSRPWIRNTGLLKAVLRRLVNMIAGEWEAATYQTALLLAWDLLDPAIESLRSEPEPVLALLSTLQLHAEDETPSFKERPSIARHWLYEKTNSQMMKRLVMLAKNAGQLKHFSLLGMAAAPLLVKDYYGQTQEEKTRYLEVFRDIREAVQAVVIETLPDARSEEEVGRLLPILRACGLDPPLAMQLSPWVAKGTPELKRNILAMIEELGDPSGGPAIRLAVLDDDETIAAEAVRVMASIRFTTAGPLLIKAAQVRRKQHPEHDRFLAAVCQVLGEWAQPEAAPFLMEIAHKKSLLSLPGHAPSLPARLAAIRALGAFNSPEVWQFMEQLSQERNPELQETLHEMIQKRTSEMG